MEAKEGQEASSARRGDSVASPTQAQAPSIQKTSNRKPRLVKDDGVAVANANETSMV